MYSTDYAASLWKFKSKRSLRFVDPGILKSLCLCEVEINKYARKILQRRIDDGVLHRGTIHKDITTFAAPPDSEAVGAGGGFPCQAQGLSFFIEF